MSDHTYKDLFGSGYTTYHDDGTTSHTYQDLFGSGYTTRHSDGSTSHTYQDLFGSGYTTYSDGGGTYGYEAIGTMADHSGYSGGYSGYSGGYSGYSGGYVGGYYGGYSSSTTSLPKMTFFGLLSCIATVVGIGYAAWRYTLEFSWPLAACFLLAFIPGIIQRNVKRDGGVQNVWYKWCRILTTLIGVFVIRMTAPYFERVEMLEYGIALAYLFVVYALLTWSLCPWDKSGAFVDVLAMLAAVTVCYLGHYGNPAVYYIGYDAIFAMLAVRAVLVLRKAGKDCKDSLYVFPVVLVALFVAAHTLVDIYGWTFLVEAVSRLVG